MILKLKKPLEK